jgi:hypothetical protein
VDPDTELDLMTTHVHKKGQDGYDATLNVADVQSGRNSFYILQVQCHRNLYSYWFQRDHSNDLSFSMI